MGGIIDYLARGWRNYEEDDQVLIEQQEHVETSLENPAFDSSAAAKTSATNEDDSRTVPPDLPDMFPERPISYNPISSDVDRHEDINTTASTLLQLYVPITVRKATIKSTLDSFRISLGLPPNSQIDECFRVLRRSVDSGTQLELVCAGKEPLKVKINELTEVQTPPEIKKAVGFLNAVLNHCQKHDGEKELKVADIQYRLDDLHLMPLNKEGQQLYANLNEIPTYLEEFSTDIATLYELIYDSRDLLRP